MGSRRQIAVVIGLAVLWLAAAWMIAKLEAERRIEQLLDVARHEAQHSAASVGANLKRSFEHYRALPAALASDPGLVEAMVRFGPAVKPSSVPLAERRRIWRADSNIAALNARLATIASLADVRIAGSWAMNAAGDAFAASIAPGDGDYVGINYADREYFKEAQRGAVGDQFAVSRATNIPSLFFVSPVFSGGRFVGAIGVRVAVESLSGFLEPGMFLTDSNGIVAVARDPDLVMGMMPDSAIGRVPDDERLSRYKRLAFESLGLVPASEYGVPGLVRRSGSRDVAMVATHGRPGDLLTVNVVRPVSGINVIRSDQVLLAFLLATVGVLAIVSIAGAAEHLRSRFRHSLEVEKLNRALTVQAHTDSLTGCTNRRHFLEVLDEERSRALRYGKDFSLLSLDLDHFKEINDRYGHPVGDEALCRFTVVVNATLRASDTLGRTGGEEFSILLPETSLAEAVKMAERIRNAIALDPIHLRTGVATMTVSIGVAELSMTGTDTAEMLLARADESMYAAKRAGRNRVMTQPPG